MLNKPSHIAQSQIKSDVIHYPWDEWNVRASYAPVDEALLARLTPLTHRSQVGLTIASAEWIAFRFEHLTTERVTVEYLEAAWAANVDLLYCPYIRTDDEEWRGPVLGPLNIALTIVIDALFFEAESANPAENPCWMANLARLVLPETAEFDRWHAACVERLERFYRRPDDAAVLFDADDRFDPLVPRDLFDPQFDFTLEATASLIKHYLAGLDVPANRFLRDPEELIEIGFSGIPYAR